MNHCTTTGIVLCTPVALAVLAWLYVKWVAYILDRYENNFGYICILAALPFACPGIILIVIGLLQGVT